MLRQRKQDQYVTSFSVMNFKNYFPAIRLRYQRRDERLTTKLITKKELKLCPHVEANQLNYVQECIMSKHWHGSQMQNGTEFPRLLLLRNMRKNHITQLESVTWSASKSTKDLIILSAAILSATLRIHKKITSFGHIIN